MRRRLPEPEPTIEPPPELLTFDPDLWPDVPTWQKARQDWRHEHGVKIPPDPDGYYRMFRVEWI
ncbi:hypothetical protein ABRQ22_06600 [Cellulosimicrobium sp. ES-005]|uniref:Uncharacterized protein n=1 Tax=Cellulosimicrobium sp. ES-005 TaxID=3163031 RepID=A0AAU8G4H5_9MICO